MDCITTTSQQRLQKPLSKNTEKDDKFLEKLISFTLKKDLLC